MKIYCYNKTMSIRELGRIEDGKLRIELAGVPEGETVTLRSPDGRYAVNNIADGVATFEKEFLTDGQIYSVIVGIRSVGFAYSNGALLHVYDDVNIEITKMWEVIADLAESLKTTDGKISKFVDGYETE